MLHDPFRESHFQTNEKRLGVQISVDDFGIGYSSLNYLRELPIDRLKINKSFIGDVTVSSSKSSIISTIVYLAHNLNLHVIAEGVEEEAQVEFLKRNDCPEIQGSYFGKSLPVTEFEEQFVEVQHRAKKWKCSE
ncbi:EAL domain-containing protein [Anaerobacillus sp. MEB173]|uniref:EAL domain-containing protein n=1 Tax=Anaerobacillus sp. MEB173 TaxID=3383345 RepID=UPI003F9240F9